MERIFINIAEYKMRLLLLISMFFINITVYSQHMYEQEIRKAVERQIRVYPHSTLRDLYKNFFQDRFGPGHIINDTVSAGAYLREELASREQFEGALYEPTGYLGNFYRVNLAVIKEGLVDYQTYFNVFVRSVNGIQPISVEEWKKEWEKINSIISGMNLKLHSYAQDSIEIAGLLQQDKYVMHHSRAFNEAYDLHYRIMDKNLFKKELLPLMKQNIINH